MDLFLILNLFMVLLAISMNSTDCSELHRSMSRDQRQTLSSIDDVENDNHRKRVKHSIRKRDINKFNNISFNYFVRSVELKAHKMHPVFSTNVPIWWVDKKSRHYSIERVDMDTLNEALTFYQDPENMAGVGVVEDEYGHMEFTTHLRDRSTVEPISEKLRQKWGELFHKTVKIQHHRFPDAKDKDIVPNYRVVTEHEESHVASPPPENYSDKARTPISSNLMTTELQKSKSAPPPSKNDFQAGAARDPSDPIEIKPPASGEVNASSRNKKRNAPLPHPKPISIYPRILLYVNFAGLTYPMKSENDLDFHRLLIYIVSFWNSVNLKFIQLENPRIRLRIAGIIIAKSLGASPFLHKSYMPDGVPAELAMKEFDKFLREHKEQFGDWDIAIFQSDKKLCKDDDCKDTLTGFTKTGGRFCAESLNSRIHNLAFVHDTYDFRGIETAVHELGHLFGAQDDEKKGRFDEGFIMSPHYLRNETHRIKNHLWSDKSKKGIQKKLSKSWSCLPTTSPANPDEDVPEILPGHMMNFNDHCQIYRYKQENRQDLGCAELHCNMGLFTPSFFVAVPYDGSYCKETGDVTFHCKNQKCLPNSYQL